MNELRWALSIVLCALSLGLFFNHIVADAIYVLVGAVLIKPK